MHHDRILTTPAVRAWVEATTGTSPGLKLAAVLAATDADIPEIDPSRTSASSPLDWGESWRRFEEVGELAWNIADPRPVDVRDLWNALVCTDVEVRCALEKKLGTDVTRRMHREALCAVLGERVVRVLECRLGRPSSGE